MIAPVASRSAVVALASCTGAGGMRVPTGRGRLKVTRRIAPNGLVIAACGVGAGAAWALGSWSPVCAGIKMNNRAARPKGANPPPFSPGRIQIICALTQRYTTLAPFRCQRRPDANAKRGHYSCINLAKALIAPAAHRRSHRAMQASRNEGRRVPNDRLMLAARRYAERGFRPRGLRCEAARAPRIGRSVRCWRQRPTAEISAMDISTSAADLKFRPHWPRARFGTSNRQAALERYVRQCPFRFRSSRQEYAAMAVRRKRPHAVLAISLPSAACAAASRAMGTRNGEHDT